MACKKVKVGLVTIEYSQVKVLRPSQCKPRPTVNLELLLVTFQEEIALHSQISIPCINMCMFVFRGDGGDMK